MWQAREYLAGWRVSMCLHQIRKETQNSLLGLSHLIYSPLSLKIGSYAYGDLVSR